MRHRFFFVFFIASILNLSLFSAAAYAYVDPGSGSLFIQVIIAFVVSALFTVKRFGKMISGIIKRLLFGGDAKDGK